MALLQQYKYSYQSEDNLNLAEGKIIHVLGIQGPPGSKFKINGNIMILGPSGIFEINNDYIDITELEIIKVVSRWTNLYVDLIYDEGGNF